MGKKRNFDVSTIGSSLNFEKKDLSFNKKIILTFF